MHGHSVDEYYGELRTLWDELASAIKLPKCTCSAAAQYSTLLDNEKLHQFFIGLDPLNYCEVASGLLMLDPLPTLSYAHGKVLSAERHQIIANSQDTRPEVVGFATEGTAPSRSNGGSDIRVCSHCGRKGHEKEKCFELSGWPEWASTGGRSGRGGGGFGGRGNGRGGGRGGSRGHGSFVTAADSSRQASSSNRSEVDHATLPTLTDAQVHQVIVALKTPSSTPKLHGKADVSQWIIDSGASNHMCGNIDFFCDIHDIPLDPIGLPKWKRCHCH
ncbi:Antiviral helicase SKI2 [Bienertia sinuspersici]